MDASTSLLYSLKPRRQYLRKYSWLPDVFRVNGSIITRILGPVLTLTIWATLVAYAWSQGRYLKLTNSVVPLLSVVVGLILVFRNGSSYDRFWEGRKAVSSMTATIRSFSRSVWISVSLPPVDEEPPARAKGKTPVTSVTSVQLRRRKVKTLKLALSFAYAVKHYLRGEDGTDYEDYIGVLPSTFPKNGHVLNFMRGDNQVSSSPTTYSATVDPSKAPSVYGDGTRSDGELKPDATKRIRVKRSKRDLNSPKTTTNMGASVAHRAVEFLTSAEEMTLPLPLQIAHYLSLSVYHFRRDGFLETIGPAGMNAMNQSIQSMVDQMSTMERIANTPIPKAYGIHLKQCLTAYLCVLPLTLVTELGWGTVPVVTVVAFTLMGIEGIADEIEMPFGTDPSDIPLDRYFDDLKEEIDYMIHMLPEGGEGLYGYDDGEGDD